MYDNIYTRDNSNAPAALSIRVTDNNNFLLHFEEVATSRISLDCNLLVDRDMPLQRVHQGTKQILTIYFDHSYAELGTVADIMLGIYYWYCSVMYRVI